MRKDPVRLTGLALIVGALLFFTFWIFAATESDGIGVPWPVALGFHGIQIITLATGLVLATRLPILGWRRYLWVAGLVIAAFGSFIGLPLFAAGLLLVGTAAIFTPKYLVAGATMIPGSILWLFLFSRGAMIGNEDYPPLTESEQTLAVSGLVLMVVGLVTLGAVIIRTLRTGLRGSSGSESPGLQASSQSPPATSPPPVRTGE